MKLVLLCAVALLATAALPHASAHPSCMPTDPACEPIEQRDCPSGTMGPSWWVYGNEIIPCME